MRFGSKSYMWVHRSSEFCKDRPIVIYEYQKGRDHELPLSFYQDYRGVLVTDGLQQYQLVEKNWRGWSMPTVGPMRDAIADAVKVAEKSDPDAVRRSTAYQALSWISQIYKLEGTLKDLTPKQRLQERQKNIKPLVEEYFAWVKKQLEDGVVLPKSKTAEGLRYSVNQEKYLRVFLADGNVPIDNSASAVIYSLSETAKLNNLRPYYYFKHLLTELSNLCDEKGNIEPAKLDNLLPWSESLPDECRKPRR